MIHLDSLFQLTGRLQLGGAPEGFDGLLLSRLADKHGPLLFIARDEAHMARMADSLAFFAPDIPCLQMPAWDCLPYDRVSPKGEVVARRLATLTALAQNTGKVGVVLATVSSATQKLPPRAVFAACSLTAKPGDDLPLDKLTGFLERNGYHRTGTVMEAGEYAVRGGIVDLFPPGLNAPLRLDFFGDELEKIRAFDPVNQTSIGLVDSLTLQPVGEVVFDEESIARFRTGYRDLFGAEGTRDLLYEEISAGRRADGFEHWLPLFHEGMETLFDYLGDWPLVLDHQLDEAVEARAEQIREHYQARLDALSIEGLAAGPAYRPLPPERLYIDEDTWRDLLVDGRAVQFSPFDLPDGLGTGSADGRMGRDFGDVRSRPGENVFDALAEHLKDLKKEKRRILLVALTEGAGERLLHVLADHGIEGFAKGRGWASFLNGKDGNLVIEVAGFERGFTGKGFAVITEQDILGDRLVRPARKTRIRAENFISEASTLSETDLVVHLEHGIGRYEGLETIDVAGAAHDCLRVIYDGGDKLFVPVENIETLSRYGSETDGVQLDKLGGVGWQARKSKLKKRIRDMADKLIEIAAQRALKSAEPFSLPEGLYDEFCSGFPYVETDDQLRAIHDTIEDLGRGRPMDRLVCGDVGFGKTEVALRTAFATAMAGKQVAVVVPTTLLSRQHYKSFTERFKDLPVRVRQLSRLVTAKESKETKAGLADGTVDIVVGTHSVFVKGNTFKDLGLLVIDEEQHFGVKHKERLKQLKSDVHVLTLTATPIPRTLQLALTGVRELSLIATPPVDRLAVRTFVTPEDPVVLREAILREHYRGGQTFYVCPRIEDLGREQERLHSLVPDIRVAVAHGRMTPTDLDATMTAFTDGEYDLLLCTNIVESGLDLPRVNTIILHRADRFGLAQLYQLRGRVGRSKKRAYAYLTLPPGRKLTAGAQKRLEVMQTLDTLGAGFTLASHDLDIRGAGNLLGEEQSGHIKEVGIELYQHLLEEAVAEAKGLGLADMERDWSPQLNLGIPVLIPDTYVADLGVRMGLYRRLATLDTRDAVEGFAAELLDRFGPLPSEAENLLQTVVIKQLCKQAHVAKVDTGPKGAVLTFHENSFPNPAGLVAFITKQTGTAKLRPDHKMVYRRNWPQGDHRVIGVRRLMIGLAEVAAG
ncbi:transcription-repair coupling factor [Magnetospira sp. QH-2]|uniref:transcription-repair coupling factor n=1 Tax=Magnetospira sp. (strain QH-2) TaxID=1288970 RepID=UPI0003E816C3|nr:transcription-repair coupling factor [Magnetospira sp. QH-2]CCQ73775.1 transcription repair coupling factor Mfd [Magnetospira sp. QH-2]